MKYSPGEVIKIPGLIDVHAHFREPGGEAQETIASGSAAARAGGYQAFFDMPNNPNGYETWTHHRLRDKINRGYMTSKTKFGFYAGVDLENPAFDEIPFMQQDAAGLKIYFGKTTGNVKEHNLEVARPYIDAWMVSAKRERELSHIRGLPPILIHAREHVGFAVAEYIAAQGYPVHWCHLSTATEMEASRNLIERYPEHFTSGVTPHHLTLTKRNADFQQGWNGARMMPPLAGEVDAEALLYGYNQGYIPILETDHAPHTHESKMRAESENPEGSTEDGCVTCFGVSGIEFVLPVMMSLVQRGKIDMERLIDSLYDQPARMLGLHTTYDNKKRTTIEIGPYVIGEDDIEGKSRNTPYVGFTGWARVLGVDIKKIEHLTPGHTLTV